MCVCYWIYVYIRIQVDSSRYKWPSPQNWRIATTVAGELLICSPILDKILVKKCIPNVKIICMYFTLFHILYVQSLRPWQTWADWQMLRRSCVERVLTFLRTGLHHPVALKLQAAGTNLGHQVALESNYIKLLHNHYTTSCYLLLPGTTSVILWHFNRFNRFNRNFDFQPLLVQDLIEALKQRRGRDMSASEIQLTAQHGSMVSHCRCR